MELQKKWFVYVEDHHEGPFSPEEIYQKQKSGKVNAESYVWCEGMADWQLIDQVKELAQALEKFKPAGPAPTIRIPNPAAAGTASNSASIAGSPTVSTKTTSPQAASSAKSSAASEINAQPKKKTSPVQLLLISIFAFAIVGFVSLAGLSQFAGEELHATLRPFLAKLVDRAPALNSVFRLAPKIQDLSAEQQSELEQAMIGTPSSGVRVGIALAQVDPNRPYFYVSTNLPDKTKFDLYLIGNGETLLNRLQFSTQATLTSRVGLAKSEPILAIGGQPIPKGEYQVYLIESSEQDPEIRPLLESLAVQRAQVQAPKEVPAGSKLLFVKSFFIGGERDQTYLTRLKAFHEKVKNSAERETQELKQYSDTLSMQFTALTQEFEKFYKSKKLTPQIKVAWAKAVANWQQIHGQLDQTIQTWSPETLQNEFFYGKTYELVKGAHQSLQTLYTLESGFFEKPDDRAGFEIQHGKAMSEARDSLDQLKSRVDAILKSPKSPSGLPTREVP